MGLELARQLAGQGEVIITGRTDPEVNYAEFHQVELSSEGLAGRIGRFVDALPGVDTCIYAAGFYQGKSLTELTDEQVEAMLDVGARGLIYVVRDLLKKQGKLEQLVIVTSSSQYTPRPLEAIYNFVKSGEALFGAAMAQDERVGKVLVAAPSGMQTAFWREQPGKDTSEYMEPKWVAERIIEATGGEYEYKEIRLLRGTPPTVEDVTNRT